MNNFWDEWLQRYCECGHAVQRHEIEPPHPCYECDCQRMSFDQRREKHELK